MQESALTATRIMELTDVAICLPLVLIMNFSLFQYLVTMFYRRRHERLARLLLALSFLSFASLVPFAYPDVELARNLNDISETCTVLTFLVQINILTRDVNKKMKLKALVPLIRIGELLALLGMGVLVCNFVDIVAPVVDMDVVEHLDGIVQNASLVFIVGFRFFFLSMAKGFATVWRTQKLEIFFYVLFLSHQYPFLVLNRVTGLSWEHVQGVWMRITIVMCLWPTVKARIASHNTKLNGRTTGRSTGARGPSTVFENASMRSVASTRPGPSASIKVPAHRLASVVPVSSSVLS